MMIWSMKALLFYVSFWCMLNCGNTNWKCLNGRKKSMLRIKLVRFHGHPPYSIVGRNKRNNTDRGIMSSYLKQLQSNCKRFADVKLNTINLPSYYNITQLITTNNITKVREMLNVDNNEDLIIEASSYNNLEARNIGFRACRLTNSPGSVLIVRNADALLLLRLFAGIRNSFPVLFFAVLVAVLVSVLVWLSEHQYNEDFPKSFGKGLWTSFWFSMVSMTTVGYGDKAPKFWLTRIICMVWMCV